MTEIWRSHIYFSASKNKKHFDLRTSWYAFSSWKIPGCKKADSNTPKSGEKSTQSFQTNSQLPGGVDHSDGLEWTKIRML